MVSKEPAKGMKDILPAEMRLRNEVLDTMREVYRSFGFEQIARLLSMATDLTIHDDGTFFGEGVATTFL